MQLRRDEVVFTNHAKERLEQRKISEAMILSAIEMPQKTYTQDDGGMKFICRINGRNVHVVCLPLPEERKWLVKTVWVRGEDDEGNVVKHRYSKRRDGEGMPLIDIVLILMIGAIIIGAVAFWYYYTGGF